MHLQGGAVVVAGDVQLVAEPQQALVELVVGHLDGFGHAFGLVEQPFGLCVLPLLNEAHGLQRQGLGYALLVAYALEYGQADVQTRGCGVVLGHQVQHLAQQQGGVAL